MNACKKPDVSKLLLFECVTFVDIPDNQWKKLESKKSIFVGHPKDVKDISCTILSRENLFAVVMSYS